MAKAGAGEDGETMVAMVKSLAAAIDRELLLDARTTREILRETIAEREFNTRMLVGFALFGILLAGVYALVAYETSRRTHELGIRMALGATPSDVVRVVIGRSMALSGAGAAAGLVVAYALGRMMKSMVYGVSPYDAVSFTGALALLLATALIAAFVPALRATRIDPLVALRHD